MLLDTYNTGLLNAVDELFPAGFAVFLHDGSDEDPVRVLLFQLLELFEHGFERSVADEFYVLPPDYICFG